MTDQTTPTMDRSIESVKALADRLTTARKAMIRALPADGSWGAVPSRSVAKRAWWRMLPPVIDHKHCPEDENEWALTEVGQAIRAALDTAEREN